MLCRRDRYAPAVMRRSIPFVVVFDDFLDAHEPLFARLDVPHEVVEVAVCRTTLVVDLVVEITVSGYYVDDDLICHEVFPVCAGWHTAVEHGLCGVEVSLCVCEEVADLYVGQRLPHPERAFRMYRVVSERLCRVQGRAYNLRNGRVRASTAPGAAVCASTLCAIGVAVHGVAGQRS